MLEIPPQRFEHIQNNLKMLAKCLVLLVNRHDQREERSVTLVHAREHLLEFRGGHLGVWVLERLLVVR